MDLTGIDAAVKAVNAQTIPELKASIEEIVAKALAQLSGDLHGVLDRLDGITITLKIPPRKA